MLGAAAFVSNGLPIGERTGQAHRRVVRVRPGFLGKMAKVARHLARREEAEDQHVIRSESLSPISSSHSNKYVEPNGTA